ncbi:MAG TPA: hypothetical protein VFI45_05335 [Candidatus Acidoferrum sp.]|nr:hypothetical protein [Candidatus Acidoferrum sp.]
MSDQQILYWVIAAGFLFPYSAAALIRWRRRSQELRAPEAKKANNYAGLRAQILNWKCPQVGSSGADRPGNPCAVAMDWAVTTGVATVVAVSDGTASIYYSSGGGSIGGGYARPAIRDAALHAVSIAGKFLDSMQLTDNFPLPEREGVIFYVVTDTGVFTAKASVELLTTNRHPLSELGNSMQTIVTEYRMLETTVQ